MKIWPGKYPVCLLLFNLCWLMSAEFRSGGVWAQDGTVIHQPTGMRFTGGVVAKQYDYLSSGPLSNPTRVYYVLDGARRIVLPEPVSSDQGVPTPPEDVFELRQQVVRADRSSIRSVGSVLRRMPFNEFGRRQIYVDTNKGPVWLLEGITELAPKYARVQGIEMDGQGLFEFPFDYRISTTTIPGDLLVQLLRNATADLNDYHQRLSIVQFLYTAERYRDALRELRRLLTDFPDLPDLQKENALKFKESLTTEAARLVLNELEMRIEAGQFQLVREQLKNFDPTDVTPETVAQADAQRRQLESLIQSASTFKQKIQGDFDAYLAEANLDEELKTTLDEMRQEILNNLNPHNVNRLSTYGLRSNDAESTPEKRLSFLISGWLLGAADAIDNIQITFSMVPARELLIQYLNSTSDIERAEILDRLRALEGGAVRYLAPMARQLLPWKKPPAPEPQSVGFFRLQLMDLPGQPEFLVQLPPEYDPYKKYPCVLSACDIGQSPEREIEWWDATLNPATGLRTGNASRHGYITIAPDWRKPLEYSYDYGPHAANVMLSSLREACRMFSIDSDRVFLSGHGVGGEVAWDIGLAHPDTWAGVVPISAVADRYITFYKENPVYNLPFYFVLGENHIPPMRATIGNMDKREDVFKHMARSTNFNFIVVIYRGRRSEHFYEEILSIFKWMRTQRRKFYLPERKFRVASMRPWDNYFWFFEADDLPRVVLPPEWFLADDKGATQIEGEIKQTSDGNTNIQVSGGGTAATFWLSPQWSDLDKEILINWKGIKTFRGSVQPSRRVLLEDLRRRSDTNNPFWAKVRWQGGWVVNDGQ